MAKRTLSLRPKSVYPFQAAKAWLSRAELKLEQIVVSDANWHREQQRVRAEVFGECCQAGSRAQEGLPQAEVRELRAHLGAHAFARKWKAKRFGKSKCTIKELMLKCCARTARRALKAVGFFWQVLPRKM